MPVSVTGSPEPPKGHKRPRSQLSNGSGPARSSPPVQPGPWSSNGAWGSPNGTWTQQGAWSSQFLGPGGANGGPTVNIPDSRFGYTSPIPPNMYNQVRSSIFVYTNQSVLLYLFFKKLFLPNEKKN